MIPYQANGIYPSEVKLVVEAARRHEINLFLESGIDNGYSTECWATAFPFAVRSTDLRSLPDTAKRLAHFSNLQLFVGPADVFLRQWLAVCQHRRIGIFLDGPKYEEAAALATEIMKKHAAVKFIAIHDALERGPFESIPFKKTFSIDAYDGTPDAEAHEFNLAYGAHYPKGPGLLLIER